jgi:hypothetical protein
MSPASFPPSAAGSPSWRWWRTAQHTPCTPGSAGGQWQCFVWRRAKRVSARAAAAGSVYAQRLHFLDRLLRRPLRRLRCGVNHHLQLFKRVLIVLPAAATAWVDSVRQTVSTQSAALARPARSSALRVHSAHFCVRWREEFTTSSPSLFMRFFSCGAPARREAGV